MSAYPDIITSGITATLPLQHATAQAILKTEFENGKESRRLIWDSVRRSVKINYSTMYFEYANELRRFYENMRGPYHSFTFFFPQIEQYVNELVGTLTSSATTINLPSKNAQSYELRVNGSPLVEGIGEDWIFTAEGGPDGEDLATFDELLTFSGDVFFFDFTGQLKIKARFSEKPIVFSDVKKYWSSTTVELIGLEPSPI
ncbi:MAG: hypothetical protein KAS32_15030 [Candidatus Peribacteraceae bacterium]|nr:hypothetical protein [Candidatus Peribacteraceae bacterium]